MYTSCKNRVQCASRALLNGESKGNYEYRMNLSAVLAPNSICVGSGPGNLACSNYGGLRKKIGGLNGTGPVVSNRSYFSSGCAPSSYNDIVDTQSQPMSISNPEGVNLNKGGNLTGFSTRNFQSNVASFNERPIANYFMFPKNWSEGYTGISSVGGWKPSRVVGTCRSNAKYRQFENSPISAGSYGSYGM